MINIVPVDRMRFDLVPDIVGTLLHTPVFVPKIAAEAALALVNPSIVVVGGA